MKNLNFETGLETYKVNDRCDLTFNPTDAAFVERLYKTFEALDQEQSAYADGAKSAENVLTFARQRDAAMRGRIDDLFGAGTADAIFGDLSTFGIADGLPLWANFLLAVLDEVAEACARAQKEENPRIKKYLEKYKVAK